MDPPTLLTGFAEISFDHFELRENQITLAQNLVEDGHIFNVREKKINLRSVEIF